MSNIANIRKGSDIAVAPARPWSSTVRPVIQGLESLKSFIARLAHYLNIVPYSSAGRPDRGKGLAASRKPRFHSIEYRGKASTGSTGRLEGGPRLRAVRRRRDFYYDNDYYSNIGHAAPILSQKPERRRKGRPAHGQYYEGYDRPIATLAGFSGQAGRVEIERQWKEEIERYIRMGGDKDRFIDFISAAKTGFPNERDRDANEKVRLFREDFIRKASREDIVHIMALHENIRSRLEQSRAACLAEGKLRTYRECTGRVSRLDRGLRQLQFILKRKSARFAV
ncbi:hypothetical protein [Bordetella genomosp. 11]|nr:hypothetical protein [Bordetella genomosp. 11]